MKRIMFLAFAMFAATCVVSAQDAVIFYSNLPAISQSFVEENFDKADITAVRCTKGRSHPRDFKVYFDDGSKVRFSKRGIWEKVKVGQGSVPRAIVPVRVTAYVKNSYPQQTVTSIARDGKHFHVELSNGMELVFNVKGRLVKVE